MQSPHNCSVLCNNQQLPAKNSFCTNLEMKCKEYTLNGEQFKFDANWIIACQFILTHIYTLYTDQKREIVVNEMETRRLNAKFSVYGNFM